MLQDNGPVSRPRQHHGAIPSAAHPQPVEAIIFDIGRVIVRLEPRRALAILTQSAGAFAKSASPSDSTSRATAADSSATADKMWAAVQADPMWHDWQEGRVTAAQWHENICRRFGLKVSFEDFCRAWNNVIAPDLILPERLFRQLAKRVRLVLLSNTDVIHVEHMQSAFTFTRYFDAKIYSCEVGASKPGRAIFQAALKAAGTPACTQPVHRRCASLRPRRAPIRFAGNPISQSPAARSRTPPPKADRSLEENTMIFAEKIESSLSR